MKDVPFYANHEDNMRCMLAVYRSVIAFFLHKELTWEELIELTGYQPKRAAWSIKALTTLDNTYGLSVKMIEPFNYRRYASEGKDYLYDLYDNEEVQWYLNNTNILDIAPSLKKFLATVRPICRRATLEDIDEMLAEERLVSITVNGWTLNDRKGFSIHAILVIGQENDGYIAHDPGLPSHPYRRIPPEKLWEAMGGDSNTSEVTGFKVRMAGQRLDQYVVWKKPMLSRSYVVKLITDGKVLVNGKPSKPGYKLRDKDSISIDYDEADHQQAANIDLPVLYEDDDCVVMVKPAGVLTHNKGVHNPEATVASFLLQKLYAKDGESAHSNTSDLPTTRAGIVHRLDRLTSGVMIGAKNAKALAWLQKQFAQRKVTKTYVAIVQGRMTPTEAIIDMPLERNPKAPATFRVGANGKAAVTHYRTLETSEHYSLLELQPQTGRTHQLRVHLAQQGHPIVGDTLYKGQPAERLFLHARELEITLPNKMRKTFSAPLPSEFKQFIKQDA